MPGPSLGAQANGMEMTTAMYREAEMAYRTSYLSEQLQRSAARKRRRDGTAQSKHAHLRWYPHRSTAS